MDSEYFNHFNKLKSEIEKFNLSESPHEEEYLLRLTKGLKLLTLGFHKVVPYFERMSVNKYLPENNNESIQEIRFLKNPPNEFVTKYGRANLKNRSVLYGTFILPTALQETNPDEGDLITISKWKLKKDNTPLLVYPVFDYFNTKDYQLLNVFNKAVSKMPDTLKELIIGDACLVASSFSKTVEKGQEINYTLSAHLADKIFNEVYNGQIEAIIYPSVKDSTDSANIALKPKVFEQKYNLSEVRETIVVSKTNRQILLHEKRRTQNFKDGRINW